MRKLAVLYGAGKGIGVSVLSLVGIAAVLFLAGRISNDYFWPK